MDATATDLTVRLDVFIDQLAGVLPRCDQRQAFAWYVAGLTSDAERKSLEPIAARLAPPTRAGAMHQTLHHFVTYAPWPDHPVRRTAAAWALFGARAHGPVTTTILDDTGFPKQGTHSVGVARQYSGTLGKVDNCQVAVSLSVATAQETIPLDLQLYLPEAWAFDTRRRAAARIPDAVLFQPKWELAIDMLQLAHADGVPLGDLVLADADYGRISTFRREVRALGLHYGVGVQATQRVAWDGRVCTVADVAAALPRHRFRWLRWRDGTKGRLSGRFARVRVRVTNASRKDPATGEEQWLVIERAADADHRYTLCTLPATMTHTEVVRRIKERGRTERVYQDLKDELGLDHYEGRSWPGWNHHVSVVLCCYALLVGERCVAFPPSDAGTSPPRTLDDPAATPHCGLARDAA
jgi:SRSO17 transposase